MYKHSAQTARTMLVASKTSSVKRSKQIAVRFDLTKAGQDSMARESAARLRKCVVRCEMRSIWRFLSCMAANSLASKDSVRFQGKLIGQDWPEKDRQ